LLWQSLKDYDLWPLYILGLTFQLPAVAPQQYLTLALRGLKFTTFQTNLLSIPYNVLHMFTMLLITYLAEIFGELTFMSMTGQVWLLPFLIYLNVFDYAHANKWIIWAVLTLLLSYPNAHPIQVCLFFCNMNLLITNISKGRLEFPQLQYSPLTHRLRRMLQHVRTNIWYHLVQHLSRRRCTTVQAW
jgi:hypothetical protein